MALRAFYLRLVMPAALIITAALGGGWKWENMLP